MNEVLEKNDEFSKSFQKNIIYGNPVINKYGKFRCFCCPISSKGITHFYLLKKNVFLKGTSMEFCNI